MQGTSTLDTDLGAVAGSNVAAAPVELLYCELERDGDGAASRCPTCEMGTLVVYRHPDTLLPLRHDRCLLCGQRVVYMDDEIRGEPFHELGRAQ